MCRCKVCLRSREKDQENRGDFVPPEPTTRNSFRELVCFHISGLSLKLCPLGCVGFLCRSVKHTYSTHAHTHHTAKLPWATQTFLCTSSKLLFFSPLSVNSRMFTGRSLVFSSHRSCSSLQGQQGGCLVIRRPLGLFGHIRLSRCSPVSCPIGCHTKPCFKVLFHP